MRFSELPDDERSLLRTAIEEDGVAVCLDDGTRAGVLRSFADRVSADTHLGTDAETHGLWVRLTDVVGASTAASPSVADRPCC